MARAFRGSGTNWVSPRWRVPVGFGFSSPVIDQGRVFVTDLALARAASQERVRCHDETDGRLLWSLEYPVQPPEWAFTPGQESGPNATPVVERGRVFALGWHGHLHCVNASDGKVLWRRNLATDYPDAELRTTASPLIDGSRLIVVVGGKPEGCVVAFETDTGRELWRALSEGAGYSSPILTTIHGERQLVVWTTESLVSLDPRNGAVRWRVPINVPADMVVSTPVRVGEQLLVGGMMFGFEPNHPEPTLRWPTDGKLLSRVLSVTSTAYLADGFLYSPRLNGEFVCLEAGTGRQVWSTNSITDRKPGASIHVTPTGGDCLLYTDRGELLRASLSSSGYRELARASVVTPVTPFGGRNVAWTPPAFANGCAFVRTAKEMVCVALAAEP